MTTTLSKSRYLAGCQCPKRLWLASYAPELATAADASAAARLAMGTEIGRRAHALFPGGVPVGDEAWRYGDAVARTRALLADPNVPAIFEAAFVHAGVRIRVDVLERLPGGAWGLREVKSGTRAKDVHLSDAAVQRFVLEGAGLGVASVEIIHVDRSYVRGDAGIDWQKFFKRVDVTTGVESLLREVPARVENLLQVLTQSDSPVVEPDEHCFTPRRCEFWAHCTRDKTTDWVFHLRPRADRRAALRAAGIERIADIPDDFPLTARQARMRAVLRDGREYVSTDLAAALAGTGPPADYLDFETMGAAIPLYPGTRPYERIPFQWSLHHLDAAGVLGHRGFLADGRADPRTQFVETLLQALGGRHSPILVYSRFEADVLRELAQTVPERATELGALRARLVDLFAIVRRHVYHAAFDGSFSLKAVAPALVPGFGYDDLSDVTEGGQAEAAFLALVRGGVGGVEEERVRSALWAYCERDTRALVEVLRALRERVGGV